MIVTVPVIFMLRTVTDTGDIPISSQIALGILVALPLAGLHWWFGKSLGLLGDYVLSLAAFQLVIGIPLVVVLATLQVELTTETLLGTLVTGGVFCVVYLSAYYRTYGGGDGRSQPETTA